MAGEKSTEQGKTTRWQTLWNSLIQVNIVEDALLRRGRLLSILLISVLVGSLGLLVVNLATYIILPTQTYLFHILGDVAFFTLTSIIYLVNRAGYVKWASFMFLIAWLIFTTFFFPIDVLDRVLLTYAIGSVAASFLLFPSASFISAALSLLGYGISYLIASPEYVFNYISIIVLFLIAFVSWVVASLLENALLEAKQALMREQDTQFQLRREIKQRERASEQLRQELQERKRMEEKLHYISIHDPLTDLYNRSYFEDELNRLNNSRQFPISIIMIDIDGLKVTNDRRGHFVGDLLLKQTAALLRNVFRSEDIVARIGGDEFVVILPKTDQTSVEQSVQRIRDALDMNNIESKGTPLSFSIGFATGETNGSLANILKLADRSMYQDKKSKEVSLT